MTTEQAHPETPIQRILRENQARIINADSEANIESIAKRLFNLQQVKESCGMRVQDNSIEYAKRLEKHNQNPLNRNVTGINQLSRIVKAVAANARVAQQNAVGA